MTWAVITDCLLKQREYQKPSSNISPVFFTWDRFDNEYDRISFLFLFLFPYPFHCEKDGSKDSTSIGIGSGWMVADVLMLFSLGIVFPVIVSVWLPPFSIVSSVLVNKDCFWWREDSRVCCCCCITSISLSSRRYSFLIYISCVHQSPTWSSFLFCSCFSLIRACMDVLCVVVACWRDTNSSRICLSVYLFYLQLV